MPRETHPHPGTPTEADFEVHRRELTGYCYRMLGSAAEADDAVQDTMIKAWRSADRFEGRSSVRSWLYRIATNVCLDHLRGRGRRAQPMDLGPASVAENQLGAPMAEHHWVGPIPDERLDPAEVAEANETVRLAFVAALQDLPPRQRAVLVLCEVLKWQATEAAELLEMTVAGVNSALQRARATLATRDDAAGAPALGAEDEALLARYVDAFQRYDVEELVTLLHDDLVFSMPPFALWLRGPGEAARWYVGQGAACEGSTLLSVRINGGPGFAAYKPAGDATLRPFAIQLVEVADGRIIGLHHFLGPELFEQFGLPAQLPA